MAAYTSPKLEVTQAGATADHQGVARPERRPDRERRDLRAGRDAADDEPGARDGARAGARRIVKALDLAGADLPLEGQLVVARSRAGPGAIAGGVHRARGAARDVGHGARGGGTDAQRAGLPRRNVRRADRTRPCVHPDLPAAAGRPGRDPGRATFGAKVYSAAAHGRRRLQRGAGGRVGRVLDAVQPGRGNGRTSREPSRRRPRSQRAP